MTDIVERLRNLIGQYIGDADIDPELIGAADEIERLREALRKIADGDQCTALLSHPPICSRAYQARKALGEKK